MSSVNAVCTAAVQLLDTNTNHSETKLIEQLQVLLHDCRLPERQQVAADKYSPCFKAVSLLKRTQRSLLNRGRLMSSRPVYRMCAQVAPSAEYLRGHCRVAVDVTALRRLWQHLPVLGLVILACVPVGAVVVAVCQLMNKDYYYYCRCCCIWLRELLVQSGVSSTVWCGGLSHSTLYPHGCGGAVSGMILHTQNVSTH